MAAFDSENQGWHAVVQPGFGPYGVRFCLGQLFNGTAHMVEAIGEAGIQSVTRESGASTEAWLGLPECAARALLDALSQHFGGTNDTRQARRDFEAERARSDKLTDALVAIAKRTGGA